MKDVSNSTGNNAENAKESENVSIPESKAGSDNAPLKSGSGKKRSGIILGIIAVVVIAALVSVIAWLLNRPEEVDIADDPPARAARGVVAMPDNIDELREKFSGTVADGYYETRMNTEWVFETWDTASENAFVANAETNSRTVYVDVTLSSSDTLVYSSPYIPVGATLTEFSLDAELKAGEYPAVATYNLVDDDNNVITTVAVAVTLYVLA